MPLPIFPTVNGAPGDGDLIAVYGGGSTEVIGGLVHHAQAVEAYAVPGLATVTVGTAVGQPLVAAGVTLWLKGSLLLDPDGTPTTTDFADILTRWATVQAKLLLANYELFLYYRTASPATYRKYKTVNTVFLHSFWNNPTSLSYLLAATTGDRTLYTTAPGA